MSTEIITLLIRLAIAIIAGILAPAVKHWLDTKTEGEQMQNLKRVAETAVWAAEQMWNAAENHDPDGIERRKFAQKAISQAALRAGIAVTDRDVDMLIEAAVQEINLFTHKGDADES